MLASRDGPGPPGMALAPTRPVSLCFGPGRVELAPTVPWRREAEGLRPMRRIGFSYRRRHGWLDVMVPESGLSRWSCAKGRQGLLEILPLMGNDRVVIRPDCRILASGGGHGPCWRGASPQRRTCWSGFLSALHAIFVLCGSHCAASRGGFGIRGCGIL